jgi:hypothetical protein
MVCGQQTDESPADDRRLETVDLGVNRDRSGTTTGWVHVLSSFEGTRAVLVL